MPKSKPIESCPLSADCHLTMPQSTSFWTRIILQVNFREGFRSWLFWLGLGLKLLMGATLASSFYAELFIPFVNQFVSSGLADPYQHWMEAGRPEMFPYPALMLYILALPRMLLGFLFQDGAAVGWLDLLVMRLPLIVADLLLLIILNSWIRRQETKLLVLFWLSPVLLYISYIHGQLDIIPVTLLFLSLYYQFKDKLWMASLVLGLCLATKTNMVVAVPFYLWYLTTKQVKISGLLAHIGVIAVAFVLPNLPFLSSTGFWQMVFMNREQGKVFNLRLDYGFGLAVFALPAAYYLVVVRSLAFRMFNRDLYIMFLGFAFGILIVLIPPMQGWYFWVLPFLIYFLLKQDIGQRATWAFYALTALFFAYFALVPASDFFQVFRVVQPSWAALPNLSQTLVKAGLNDSHFLSLVFTLLQTTLAINCGLIYQYGIDATIKHKIRYKPFLMGVGGDSGSGKSTFTRLMADLFLDRNVAVIRGDDMHRWERGHEQWRTFTHLDPKANLLHDDLTHALKLKEGRSIDRRHYDHQDGKFTLPVAVRSNRVVVFEGLHPFYLSQTRRLYDCKVFINPDRDLRYHWKIIRDVRDRGYTIDQIVAQLNAREADATKYIDVQAKYADIIISYEPKVAISQLGAPDLSLALILRCTLDNNINLDRLLDALTLVEGLEVSHRFMDEDHQQVVFDGIISASLLFDLIQQLVPELEEVAVTEPKMADGYNGLIQLLLAYYVFNKLTID